MERLLARRSPARREPGDLERQVCDLAIGLDHTESLVDTIEDKFEAVAAGEAIAIVVAGDEPVRVRPDLTVVPLRDVEPSHVALATRAGDRNRLVVAFRKIAQTFLGGTDQ